MEVGDNKPGLFMMIKLGLSHLPRVERQFFQPNGDIHN